MNHSTARDLTSINLDFRYGGTYLPKYRRTRVHRRRPLVTCFVVRISMTKMQERSRQSIQACIPMHLPMQLATIEFDWLKSDGGVLCRMHYRPNCPMITVSCISAIYQLYQVHYQVMMLTQPGCEAGSGTSNPVPTQSGVGRSPATRHCEDFT